MLWLTWWSTFSWLIDFIPGWAVWVVGGVALAALWLFAQPIWALLPNSVKLALGGLVAVLGAVQWGRHKGKQDADNQRAQANAQAEQKKKEISRDVDSMDEDAVDRELSRRGELRD